MKLLVCLLAIVGVTLAADRPEKGAPQPDAKLWAGLGVTSPVIYAENVTDAGFFMLSFTLVNDGDKASDPEIGSSQFLVNGKELKDWNFIVGNGPKGKDFEALPPGECLQFGYAMGKYFTEPGVYKVQWKGKAFESPEVVFRVLAKKGAGLAPGKPPPRQGQPEIDVINAGHTAMEIVKTTKDPDAKWRAVRILGSLRYEPAIPRTCRRACGSSRRSAAWAASGTSRSWPDTFWTTRRRPSKCRRPSQHPLGICEQTQARQP